MPDVQPREKKVQRGLGVADPSGVNVGLTSIDYIRDGIARLNPGDFLFIDKAQDRIVNMIFKRNRINFVFIKHQLDGMISIAIHYVDGHIQRIEL